MVTVPCLVPVTRPLAGRVGDKNSHTEIKSPVTHLQSTYNWRFSSVSQNSLLVSRVLEDASLASMPSSHNATAGKQTPEGTK